MGYLKWTGVRGRGSVVGDDHMGLAGPVGLPATVLPDDHVAEQVPQRQACCCGDDGGRGDQVVRGEGGLSGDDVGGDHVFHDFLLLLGTGSITYYVNSASLLWSCVWI